MSAPVVHPSHTRQQQPQASHQQPQRRPSGGRPAPTASYSHPTIPTSAHGYPHLPAAGMHGQMQTSSSTPGTRSGHRDENTRPAASQGTSASSVNQQEVMGSGVRYNSNHPFLQPHRPSNPSIPPKTSTTAYGSSRPAGSTRLPQPPSQHRSVNNGYGHASGTTGSNHTTGSSEVGSLTESTRVNIIRQRGEMVDMSSPKDIVLDSPQSGYVPQLAVRDEVDIHLEHLFDTLQVPDAVRQKFSTVSPEVKSSILTSSYSSNPTILKSLGLSATVGRSGASAHSARGEGGTPEKTKPPLRKRLSQPVLRKQKSASSIGSPGNSPQVGRTYRVDGESFTIVASPPSLVSPTIGGVGNNAAGRAGPPRGQSMDVGRPSFVRTSASGSRPMAFSLFSGSSGRDRSGSQSGSGQGKAKGVGLGIAANGEQPESFIAYLRSYKGTDLGMDVDKVKKLRMVLRHEKTEWIGRFLELGGYELVLARLQDLLDIEWREEQHDDQMLHELIRCVKALSTSEIGKAALRSSFPRPFDALSGLLFSEKKPGDLPVRQLIIELWTFVFELSPPASSPAGGRTAGSRAGSVNSTSTSPTLPTLPNAPFARNAQTPGGGSRPTSIRFDTAQADQLAAMLDNPGGKSGQTRRATDVDAIDAVRSFLVPKQEDRAAEQHSFITQAHRPKVFRAWVQELSDICRDYFWIMCHANNTLWAEEEVDERLVTKPVAPGGATGGVEFEAMNYVITHFRLLNTLCYHLAQRDMKAAGELHENLMMSGMDRILVTMRKASTTFYPTLHLEIARYVTHLRLASPHGRLPHLIDKLVGPPPEEYRRRREMPFHQKQTLNDGHTQSPRVSQREGQRPVSYHPQAQQAPTKQRQHQPQPQPEQRPIAHQLPVQRHSYHPAMAYDP